MPEAGSAGFTLVEMLVALFLLSLVGLTLAHFQAFAVGATATLRDREAASIAADNVAIDLLLFPDAQRASGSSENGGRHYQWSATLSPGPEAGLVSVHLLLHPEAKPGLQVTRTFLRAREKAASAKEARP